MGNRKTAGGVKVSAERAPHVPREIAVDRVDVSDIFVWLISHEHVSVCDVLLVKPPRNTKTLD